MKELKNSALSLLCSLFVKTKDDDNLILRSIALFYNPAHPIILYPSGIVYFSLG